MPLQRIHPSHTVAALAVGLLTLRRLYLTFRPELPPLLGEPFPPVSVTVAATTGERSSTNAAYPLG